jgi:hypothetical protein
LYGFGVSVRVCVCVCLCVCVCVCVCKKVMALMCLNILLSKYIFGIFSMCMV